MIKIKLHGLGGQGVVTAAKMLVHAAAIVEGRFAKSLPAYGHERRGAPIYADVMIADKNIDLNTFVYEPDMVVLFDPSVISKGIDVHAGKHSETILVVNSLEKNCQSYKNEWGKVYSVDATAIALHHLKRNIPNTAMMGAIAKTGIIDIDSVISTIEKLLSSKIYETNLQSAKEAYEKTKTW